MWHFKKCVWKCVTNVKDLRPSDTLRIQLYTQSEHTSKTDVKYQISTISETNDLQRIMREIINSYFK